MSPTTTSYLDRISSLLAEKGYEVSSPGEGTLHIREVTSGVAIEAALEGDIVFFTLKCVTAPEKAITPEIMRRMLSADSGITTSYFQLYNIGDGNTAVTLNNFCKLQDMGPDDQDDVLSCVHFLLVDVIQARGLIGSLAK
ncbi:MAG: hypothetical protein ACE15B_20800 [Bryobacteraceae bacterium]